MRIIAWLQAADVAAFRFVNQSLANPLLDWVLTMLAAWRLVFVASLVGALVFLWKDGCRGRFFILCLALGLVLADGVVCGPVRAAVERPSPCAALAGARCLAGSPDSKSFPAFPAANWFAATMVGFIFYRRSWRILAPLAVAVGCSGIYTGEYYPSDVLAGAILGGGCAGATAWGAEWLWRRLGRKWFPIWWQKSPSVLLLASRANAEDSPSIPGASTQDSLLEEHWLRLGYLLTAALLLFRLCYIASGTIELSTDEAYQWLWSKHLALSYYSKPPGIALIQFAGTSLWGDTELGVRFFSPVFAAILSVVLLRFLAREAGARQAFLLLLILTSAPLMSVGTVLMTVDPPLALFWTLSVVAGWLAVKPGGTLKHWLLAGLAAGLGFLCKYSAAYLIAGWMLFFFVWPPARTHLKRPGPYLALLVFSLCTLPVIIWNSQHDWITVHHVAADAGMNSKWRPTMRYFWEFSSLEAVLLNPVFFVGALGAMVAVWKRPGEDSLGLYLFCMGGLVFLGHWVFSLHSRVLPNWIAPAALPMFCWMVIYWHKRWREGLRLVKVWLGCGLALGLTAVALLHNSDLIGAIAGHPLPGDMDPLRRVRGYQATAAFVEQARERLLQEGKPAFIICDHYGITGLFSFYLPEARAALSGKPLVYYRATATPDNQFYSWPEYRYAERNRGENAIFVTEPAARTLEPTWAWKWLTGQEIRFARVPPPRPKLPVLLKEFETVTDLGLHEIIVGGRIMKRVELFECHNLQ